MITTRWANSYTQYHLMPTRIPTTLPLLSDTDLDHTFFYETVRL
jgi:hypothetical protein